MVLTFTLTLFSLSLIHYSLLTINLNIGGIIILAQLEASIEKTNRELNSKGVKLLILKKREKTALVYAFRKSRLQNDLSQSGVKEFLSDYGYESTDADYCIERLKSSNSFPHEIGIFLSYPLGDVKGFIENAGQNSKCSGCWKVYCNECEAIKTFEKCKKIYQKLWLQGRSIVKLTVAA